MKVHHENGGVVRDMREERDSRDLSLPITPFLQFRSSRMSHESGIHVYSRTFMSKASEMKVYLAEIRRPAPT